MLSLLRSVHVSNSKMHDGHWHRLFGRRLAEATIGIIIGVGRIRTRVLNLTNGYLKPFVPFELTDDHKKISVLWDEVRECYTDWVVDFRLIKIDKLTIAESLEWKGMSTCC